MWELLHEIRDISVPLAEIILNSPRKLIKERGIQRVLLLNLVQGRNFLLKSCLFVVIGLNDRGYSTCRKRKG